LRELVAAVREAEARVGADVRDAPLDPVLAGDGVKRVETVEEGLRHFATRGIFSITDIQPGEPFTTGNLRVLRPGELPQGLHPRHFADLIGGGVAARGIPAWTGVQWDDVQCPPGTQEGLASPAK